MNSVYNRIIQNANISINRLMHTNPVSFNHYDTLELKSSCTTKEIKESFIKLSKENHPDLNKNDNAHKKFVEISEAYKVLSNAETRHMYDLGLVPEKGNTPRTHARNVYYHHATDPWKDPSFYQNRDKSQDAFYESMPYYGIRGINRASNFTVAMICLTLGGILVGLQFLAITKSVTFQREELIRRSNEAGEALRKVREAANVNGNKEQLERLKLKFTGKLDD